MRAIRRFTVRTVLPAPLEPLGELAMNLRWSWHAETRDLFESIDPDVWAAVGRDPVRLLGTVPNDKLGVLAEDRRFLARLRVAAEDLHEYLTGPRWYQTLSATDKDPGAPPAAIAYFSPEYGITAALPQYSGGLGILAGDHLKAASDLGVPIVGVGLMYRHGYFRQSLSRDGWQQERYPLLDPNELPLTLLRGADGTPTRVVIALPTGELHARIWKAQVGRVPLLLLDSDIEENDPAEREVTDRLYGGTSEHRLHQEMLLGIGGVRALRAFCEITGHPAPEVFHTNEGHAGFLGIERIREFAASDGLDFDAALEATRAGTVFTTHTPVPAGIDRFGRDQIQRHFGDGGSACPGVPVDRVLALGAETYPEGDPGVFNMAVMGLRLAQRANGVSKLHGQVSRGMFDGLWPGFDTTEVPITSITNGVHAPTWVDADVLDLASREADVDLTADPSAWADIERLTAGSVWDLRRTLRAKLVTEARARLRESWRQRGAGEAELGWIEQVLDPDVLTIGFARRVPSYKRLTLMLRDPARLRAMLLHPERPIQIVIAGKAHPADEGGKRLIQELVRFADREDVRHRIVFLPDYDIAMAQHLYPGCDVWLNNPLRPLEACGTSGMKAALNGCLNLSILDGWWDEWYDGSNGWAIPTADGVTDVDRRDDLEAGALYDLIENSVAARFYDRGPDGLPARWLEMVRHTLATLGPKVLADRMVKDYVDVLYAPAALAGRAVTGAAARELAEWKAHVRRSWHAVRVDHVESNGIGDAPEVGNTLSLRVFVSLGELAPADVEVQVVHGRVDDADRIVDGTVAPLKAGRRDEHGRWFYEGSLALDRTGPFGYTVRVMPTHGLLASPAELGLIAVPPEGEAFAQGMPLR